MKTPLTETVSIQEMKNLREIERLSNSEIATRLNVSYQTVLKYIGKNPRDISLEARHRAIEAARAKAENDAKEDAQPIMTVKYRLPYQPDEWESSTTIHDLGGSYAHYLVNPKDGTADVTFNDGYSLGKMSKNDLAELVKEFSRVIAIL